MDSNWNTTVISNGYDNTTLNRTDLEADIVYELGVASAIINMLISAFTILFNSVIIYCARRLKGKLSDVTRKQLLSLATSDMLAGFTPGFCCLILIPVLNRNTTVCSAVFIVFFSAQYATILNMCVLAVRRWKILNNRKVLGAARKNGCSAVFVLSAGAWGLSLVVHLPMLAFFTPKPRVNGCLSPQLMPNPAGGYVIPMWGVTLLVLDIFYASCIHMLKKSRTRIQQEENDRSSERNRNQNQRTSCFILSANDDSNIARPIATAARTAFKHLFIALISANVTTITCLCAMVLFALEIPGFDTTQSDMYGMHIMALNSLVNPLVYGVHIKEVRQLIHAMFIQNTRSSDVP